MKSARSSTDFAPISSARSWPTSLGSDTAGPVAQPYHSTNSRKAKGHWYKSRLYQLRTLWLKDYQALRVEGKDHAEHPLDGARVK